MNYMNLLKNNLFNYYVNFRNCEKALTFFANAKIIVVRNEYATGIGYAEKSYLNSRGGKNVK